MATNTEDRGSRKTREGIVVSERWIRPSPLQYQTVLHTVCTQRL